MPNIGFGELIVILLIALLVFGPRRLPQMARTLGRSFREFRRAAAEFRAEMEDGLEEERPSYDQPPSQKESEPPAAERAAAPSDESSSQ